MNIMQIVGIGLTATLLAITIKQQKPEIAILISIATGIVIFTMVQGKLVSAINLIQQLVSKSNIDSMYLTTVLKVAGIAYIAEFCTQICKDAGEGAIAKKIELGGKIIIMTMAVPILAALMEVIVKILP